MNFDSLYSEKDDPWGHYKRFSLQEYDRRYLKILSRFLKAPLRVLEIACGTGYFSVKLHRQYPAASIDACDISLKAIELAKETHKQDVNFYVDKIPDLNHAARRYDLIVPNEALNYLGKEGRELAISRIKTLTAPGGHLFLSSNLGQNYFRDKELISLIESRFGMVLHYEYNFSKIHYLFVEKPALSAIALTEAIAKKYPIVKKILHPFHWTMHCLLKNKLLFRALQFLSRKFLGMNGATNIYILAVKNE